MTVASGWRTALPMAGYTCSPVSGLIVEAEWNKDKYFLGAYRVQKQSINGNAF
jgi:hypothetical protein